MPASEKMQNAPVHPTEMLGALREEMRTLMRNGGDWSEFALKVFRFQSAYNPVYKAYVALRGINPAEVVSVDQVPYLPVELFQSQWVSVFPEGTPMERIFESSGTTGQRRSRHGVDDLAWYDEVACAAFEHCVGGFEGRRFVALLPGYRQESSLIHMVRTFMHRCGQRVSDDDFFMGDFERLESQLRAWSDSGHISVMGVTHALLAWAEHRAGHKEPPVQNLEIIETGGMKGHGPERIREEVHALLGPLTPTGKVGSEYGMTELLSQAWSDGEGMFVSPPWMSVRMGATNDPGSWVEEGRQGRIHIMDLANLASCAFLATSDIGRCHADGRFEVLGRFDHAEVRGCNLLTIE
jgi:hypothetical protein